MEKRAEVLGPLLQCRFELGGGVLGLALRDKHERKDDSRLRKVRAALQRKAQQAPRARQLAAPMQQLAEVVVGIRIPRFALERSFMACDRSVDIVKGLQADPEIDVRFRVPGSSRHGLSIQVAGLQKLARAFGPIALIDQPVGDVSGR